MASTYIDRPTATVCMFVREFTCCCLALVQQSSLDPDHAGQLAPSRGECVRAVAVACGPEIGQ